jgi:hypothetical protein
MGALPDPQKSQAILVGVSEYVTLEDLPSVKNNLLDLKRTLTDPAIWGLPSDNCTVLDQPDNSTAVLDSLHHAADSATDAIVFYFAGHGLVDPDNNEELYLALPDSVKERAFRTAIPYAWIRRTIRPAKARRKIVILDCCYSGRAAYMLMGDSEEDLAGRLEIDGTYVLTATARTRSALAPPGEQYTAFTGELIGVMARGILGGPELLDMDTVYRQLTRRLRAKERPLPQRGQLDHGGDIALARNLAAGAAEAPAGPPSGSAPDSTVIRDPAVAGPVARRELDDQHVATGFVAGSTPPAVEPTSADPALATVSSAAAESDLVPAMPVGESPNRSIAVASRAPEPEHSAQPTDTRSSSVDWPEQGEIVKVVTGPTPPGGNELAPSADGLPPGLRQHPWLRRPKLALLIVGPLAGLVVAAGIVTARLLSAGPSAPTAAATASYNFPQHKYADGLAAVRGWTLSGRDGSHLTEKDTVSNATGKTLEVLFLAPIPSVIAPGSRTVHFFPPLSRYISADHTAEWRLQVPAHGSIAVSYQATVAPAGVTRARLRQWAGGLGNTAVVPTANSPGARLESLKITPRIIKITAGASIPLRLTGRLSNRKSAPKSILSTATWKIGDKAIASVASVEKITGETPGKTYVTARIGKVSATNRVTVTPSEPVPGNSSSNPIITHTTPTTTPPVHKSTPPSTTPSTTPTLTPSSLAVQADPGKRPELMPHATSAKAELVIIQFREDNRRDGRETSRRADGSDSIRSAAELMALLLSGI